jgi:hypothetical protein
LPLAPPPAPAHGIHCKKPLYHAQLNPDRALTREEWEQAIALFEKELGYENQPRAIVLHEYKGREHLHLVYSRIGEDGKAISDSWNYLHHEKAARAIESDLGLEATQGTLYQAKDKPRPERTPSQNAIQQGGRTKIDPKAVKSELTALYQQSEGNAAAFLQTLKEHGYSLARGDKRGFVVLDAARGVHSLTRATGAKAGELREMLKDCPDPPSVEEARAEPPAQGKEAKPELPSPEEIPEANQHPEHATTTPEPVLEGSEVEHKPRGGSYWQERIRQEREGNQIITPAAANRPSPEPESSPSIFTEPSLTQHKAQILTDGAVKHRGLIGKWFEQAHEWAHEVREHVVERWQRLTKATERDYNPNNSIDR